MIHAFLTSDLPTITMIMIQRYMIPKCAHDYVGVLAVLNFMYTRAMHFILCNLKLLFLQPSCNFKPLGEGVDYSETLLSYRSLCRACQRDPIAHGLAYFM
jgi:hypothetical protein